MDKTNPPKCKCCDNTVKWSTRTKSWKTYCSRGCVSLDQAYINEKRKQTNFIKYGGHPNHNKEVQEKTKQTNIERYGFENPQQNKKIKEKTIQTNLERFGFANPQQNKEVQEKTKQTNVAKFGVEYPTQNTEVQEKIKQTNLERYAVEWNIISESSKQKKEVTCFEKFGVINPFQNKDIKEKIKQTFQKNYGCHPRSTKEVQHKQKQTCLNNYGVDNPRKSTEVQEKIKQINLETYGVNNFKQAHMIDILPLINDHNWLFNQYITQNKTALRISKELGISDTTVGTYLIKNEIVIRDSHQSYVSKLWMESIQEEFGITLKYEYPFDEDNKKQKADGYCVETNTIYEFHGNYWHGNPKVYTPDTINEVNHYTMGELYQATILRENKIRSLGYNLVVMWENDWNKL